MKLKRNQKKIKGKKKQVKCTNPTCIRLKKNPIHVGLGKADLPGPLFIFVIFKV